METIALVDRLQIACATLSEVQDLVEGLPEHKEDAVEMLLRLEHCKSYLSELALNLARGEETYDAVLATARGITK